MKKTTLLYYFVMMLALLSWSNTTSSPPIYLCLIYLALLFVPILLNRMENNAAVCVLLVFSLVSANHYAPSYMPATSYYMLLTTVILKVVLFSRSRQKHLKIPFGLILISVLVLAVELVCQNRMFNVFNCFLTLIVMMSMVDTEDKNMTRSYTHALILSTLILSVDYFIFGSNFTSELSTESAVFERLGWSDPNYFSAVLGMGLVASGIELLTGKDEKKYWRIIAILTILISIFPLLRVASRGACIALLVSFVLMLLSSKMSVWKNITILAGAFLFVFILYRFHFLDFFISRFYSNTSDLGGRTYIWNIRLNSYLQESNLLKLLFGYGYYSAQRIGTGSNLGFHNDYLGFLLKYGFLGLSLFLSLFVSPLFRSTKGYRSSTFIALSYMAIISFSLEPISGGYFEFFFFLTYCFVLANSRHESVTENNPEETCSQS